MDTLQGHAAAWAAPLFSQLLDATPAPAKQTHKLPPLPCVLWLPDYRAYVRSVNLLGATFTTCPTPDGALRLGEDQLMAVGQDLIDATGVRVHVRPCHPMH